MPDRKDELDDMIAEAREHLGHAVPGVEDQDAPMRKVLDRIEEMVKNLRERFPDAR